MLHLLIASPLEQSIGSLQANVRYFQGELGDGEAGHIGGDQGGVAAYALPSRIVQRWRCLLQSRNLLHQVVHARAEACVQGVCNSCNLSQGGATASLHHLRYFTLQASL